MKIRFLIALAFTVLPNTLMAVDFEDVDIDKDGLITLDEAIIIDASEEEFDAADGDKNGTLDLNEYSALASKIQESSEYTEQPVE